MRNLFEHPLFIVVLLGLIAVLFGGKRLPEAARGLGRSMRIFKSEIKQMHDDDADETPQRPTTPVEGRIVGTRPPQDGSRPDVPSAEHRDTSA